jgi:hypothetical protein
VTIPDTVTNIGVNAFFGCNSLTQVALGANLVSLGDYAFAFCAGLASVTIPASVTQLGAAPFEDCSGLTAITVEAGNPSYSSLNGVLYDRAQTTLLECPGGLRGNFAIPPGVTRIGDYAFYECAKLTGVTCPNTVTSVGNFAFAFCDALTSVTLPRSVTTLGTYAFQNCIFLLTVTIPGSVTNLGANAFYNSYRLTSVYFTGNAPAADTTVFRDYATPPAYLLPNVTVYYLPGATGWSSTFAGVPAVLWNPQVQATGAAIGGPNHQFGFNLTGPANFNLEVDACTNLACPVWTPLQTVTLTNGSYFFSDPQCTNYPARFYRLTPP